MNRGVVLQPSLQPPSRELYKTGTVYVSLALQKTTDSLTFPIKVDDCSYMTDIEGAPQATHLIAFDANRV